MFKIIAASSKDFSTSAKPIYAEGAIPRNTTIGLFSNAASILSDASNGQGQEQDFDANDLLYNAHIASCLAAFNINGKSYSWASDSGTNHHATNDTNDYVPGTFVHQVSRIQVGSGMTMSPGYGDVMLRADFGDGKSCVLKLLHVLLLPQCPGKLVATSPFVRAGCKAVMENTDELSISNDGVLMLRGK